MARNEEKHFCRLNRLLLQQQKEEDLKKNPPRPKLVTLSTIGEIKQWIPSILRDIDFCITQSQVTCYPERKIKEFESELDRLKREYWAFVRRLKELDPGVEIVPWTERAYTNRKRPYPNTSSGGAEIVPKHLNTGSDTTIPQVPSGNYERLRLPILDSEVESLYRQEKDSQQSVMVLNCNEEMADKPLEFTFHKHTVSHFCSTSDDRDVTQSKQNIHTSCSDSNHSGSRTLSDRTCNPDTITCECMSHVTQPDTCHMVTDETQVPMSEHNGAVRNPLGLTYDLSSDDDSSC